MGFNSAFNGLITHDEMSFMHAEPKLGKEVPASTHGDGALVPGKRTDCVICL